MPSPVVYNKGRAPEAAGELRPGAEPRIAPPRPSYTRLDWRDLLPAEVAKRQTAFELNERVLRARQSGAKLREIAKGMGVSIERIRGLEANGLRRRRKYGLKSPIELWYEQYPLELAGYVRTRKQLMWINSSH
jgi:hypothetical protein